MAERRMFAKSIVLSDAFLDMPATARCLYFTLGMFADDDGFVNSPKSIMRQCGATTDDMNVLLAKKFVYGFDGGVVVIKHWRINNLLRADRHHETTYTDELKLLEVDENGAYKMVGIPSDNQVTTNCQPSADNIGLPSIGKVSIGKDSIGKVREEEVKSIGEVVSDLPTLADITIYIKSKNYHVVPERFYSYYSQREFPKNWKAVVDKWEASEYKRKPKSHDFTTTDPTTITKDTFGCEYLFEDES